MALSQARSTACDLRGKGGTSREPGNGVIAFRSGSGGGSGCGTGSGSGPGSGGGKGRGCGLGSGGGAGGSGGGSGCGHGGGSGGCGCGVGGSSSGPGDGGCGCATSSDTAGTREGSAGTRTRFPGQASATRVSGHLRAGSCSGCAPGTAVRGTGMTSIRCGHESAAGACRLPRPGIVHGAAADLQG